MTPDEERAAINRRWEETDRQLEALEGRKAELSDHRFAAERDRLLGEQDELEYRLGEIYLANRS